MPQPRHNLPLQSSSFVGREREIAKVRSLLATTRLLTLTGPGGCGKTRLALQVANELSAAYEDGVWLVELAALADPGLMPQTVAAVLGVREQSGHSLTETLGEFLRAKRLLLILDNCEHLLASCAALADALLAPCPTLHILATSRIALGTADETSWLVPPLALPTADAQTPTSDVNAGTGQGSPEPSTTDSASVGQYDAIRLFMERTASVLPSFTLTARNAGDVVQVCRRLDGLPLAIELAAARVRLLTVAQIAERLEGTFQLLTRGNRSAPPRHQTLRAAIDWSYDLLSGNGRMLLERLSVFAGGFTLEAAEAVCAAEALAANEVLDLLSELLEQSLVALAEHKPESPARFRLLETIRQYAREKLDTRGDAERARRQHAAWFLGLAEHAEAAHAGPQAAVWLDRLDLDHDNLQAALAWSGEHAPAIGARLAASLCPYWETRGFLSEQRTWVKQAVGWAERAGAGNEAVHARLLDAASLAASQERDHARALALLEQSLSVRRAIGKPAAIARALTRLGSLERDWGDLARARYAYEEGLAIWRELDDQAGLAHVLLAFGLLQRRSGDDAQAQRYLEECLQRARQIGDQTRLGWALQTLGSLAFDHGEHMLARARLEEALAVFRGIGYRYGIALSLGDLGTLSRVEQDYVAARTRLREAIAILSEIGHKTSLVDNLCAMAHLAADEGRMALAVRLLGAIDRQGPSIGWELWSKGRPVDEQMLRTAHTARTAMGEQAFDEAWAAGRRLSWEDMVALALAEPETTTAASAPGPELSIYALGSARVLRGGEALTSSDWSYAKARELLFYLLSHQPATKEQIGIALWPEASPAQLRSRFGVALHHLRRVLGNSDWIIFADQRYAFNRAWKGRYWFDVEQFEATLAEVNTAMRSTQPSSAHVIAQLEQATHLYRGDFLEDWGEGEWHLLRREELRRKFLAAQLTLGQLLIGERRYVEAAEVYRRVIGHDSYLEEAHRELMRCFARQGERGQALRHYQDLVELMRAELGSPPAAETTALYRRLTEGQAV